MIEITLNGTVKSVPPGLNVHGLLEFLELTGQPLLVEHNGNALLKSEWPVVLVAEKDQIELVRVVAGG